MITDLKYADDVILTRSMKELSELVSKAKATSKESGLLVHISNIKVMKLLPTKKTLTNQA